MDTITHFAAGACMGELMAGRRIGRKAMLIGGLAQLLPDVDFIFGTWMSPAANALSHRGVTHSFLFLILMTPIAAWAVRRWSNTTLSWRTWIIFLGIEVAAHLFLDAFNAYGTGWFEPFSHKRITFNSIFVADPFFSLPLGIALALLALTKAGYRWRSTISLVALLSSCLYLAYGLHNKSDIDQLARQALSQQGIKPQSYFTTPTPFNNWLWYVVATDTVGSYVGYRSVFDHDKDIHFEFFARNDSLLAYTPASETREVELLLKLSQGHYTVEARGDTLIFNDLRFGQMLGWQHPRSGFVFHYYLRPPIDNKLVLQRGRFEGWDREEAEAFIRRIGGR